MSERFAEDQRQIRLISLVNPVWLTPAEWMVAKNRLKDLEGIEECEDYAILVMPTTRRHKRRLDRELTKFADSIKQRGSILLELAFALPLLLLLVLGGLELSNLMLTRQNINYLAQAGARCAAQAGCDVNNVVYQDAVGLGMDTAKLSWTQDATSLTVTFHYFPLSPYLTGEVDLQATVVTP
jgi:hypothetical protein